MYEYTTHVIPPGKSLDEELNNFGKEKWQLVQLFDERGKSEDVDWIAVFVRDGRD